MADRYNQLCIEYQECTPGDDDKHWLRVKFFRQYRLFFRYYALSKVIVFVWVNDKDTRRAYESSNDAYRVFRKCWKAVFHRTTGTSCGPRLALKGRVCSNSPPDGDLPGNFQLVRTGGSGLIVNNLLHKLSSAGAVYYSTQGQYNLVRIIFKIPSITFSSTR